MSAKHRGRHEKARMIRAAKNQGTMIVAEPVHIQWIEAADAEPDKPKRFAMTAYTGAVMSVGGFGSPVAVELSGLTAKTPLPNLLNHDTAQIVGHTDEVTIEGGVLKLSGVISGGGSAAAEVLASAGKGFPWKASIGARPDKMEFVGEDVSTQVNGKTFKGPLLVARKSTLMEVSFVAVAADPKTSAKVAAEDKTLSRRSPEMDPKFVEWVKSLGLDPEELTEDQQTKLKAKYDAEIKAATKSSDPLLPPDVSGRIEAHIAETNRRRALEAIAYAGIAARGYDDPQFTLTVKDALARAIEAGTGPKDFELELIRIRPVGRIIGGGEPVDPDLATTLECGLLMACKHDEKLLLGQFGDRVLHATSRRYPGGIGLEEAILKAAIANGYVGRHRVTTGNWRHVLNAAIPIQASGFSSVDLSGILGNVANKAMAREAQNPVYIAPQLSAAASHTNFHSHTVYSLAFNGELTEVAPTGELEHMDLTQESYTRQVKTRGAVLRLSRTDIVNDDLGAFDRNAAALARKAFTTREKVFFTLLMASGAGASHFTAARGNYLTGATSAFAAAGMGVAIKGFMDLTGPDGDPILVTPQIVLVPGTLYSTAQLLLGPANTLVVTGLASTSAMTMGGQSNPYAGRFTLLTSPYLENTGITGYSSAYWYMFASPGDLPCYEIAYLNGAQQPTVEYFGLDSEADTLGVAWRAYWDFGVAAAEWRGGVKLAGS